MKKYSDKLVELKNKLYLQLSIVEDDIENTVNESKCLGELLDERIQQLGSHKAAAIILYVAEVQKEAHERTLQKERDEEDLVLKGDIDAIKQELNLIDRSFEDTVRDLSNNAELIFKVIDSLGRDRHDRKYICWLIFYAEASKKSMSIEGSALRKQMIAERRAK